MQTRYLNTQLTKSLFKLQPLVSPVIHAHTHHTINTPTPCSHATSSSDKSNINDKNRSRSWRCYLGYLLITVFILWSGVLGEEGMAGFAKYLKSLKWTPLPVGVGFALIAAQQYKHTRQREEGRLAKATSGLAGPWEVRAYKMLPLRHFSRAWGWCTEVPLPVWCRGTVLGAYARTFGCNMAEAEEEDVCRYSSLSSLFRRALKPEIRPVCHEALLTAPVDGTVLAAGPVTCGTLCQVKGVNYSLRQFLGPNVWGGSAGGASVGPMVVAGQDTDACYHASCLRDPVANDLFQLLLYLAPGDYHRFHSPADWVVSFRRHFPGELLSVNPRFAAWIQDLFVLNERVSYVGRWAHGFMSMTAVGATNVGSIKVYVDDKLRTNTTSWARSVFHDRKFKTGNLNNNKFSFKKGGPFGEFNLGSTIVLLFEAPKGSVMKVQVGQKVKMGEAMVVSPTFVNKSSTNEDEQQQEKGVDR